MADLWPDLGTMTHTALLKKSGSKIKLRTKVDQKSGPDGNYRDLAIRVESKKPLITYRTAQRIEAMVNLTAPKPPGQAYWYFYTNPPPWKRYVRTGQLAASIRRIKTGGGYIVVVDAEYAKFVEYGTSKMPANPFFHQAASHARYALKDEVKKWLKP